MRNPTFWLLALAMASGGMATSTLLVHQIPYLESAGFSKKAAASMVSFYFFISLGGRLGVGWMGDILDKRRILAAVLLSQSLGILILSRVDSIWLFIPYLILGGLAHGATVPLRPALIGEYFGRAHFGAIQGLFELPAIATGVIGPVFAGWVFDTMDTYRPALVVLAAIAAAGIPLVLLARKPQQLPPAMR